MLHSFPDVLFISMLSCFLCFSCSLAFFCLLVSAIFPSRYEKRGELSIKYGSDRDAQTKCVNCCYSTGTGARTVILICVNKGYTLYHVAPCLSYNKYCYFSILIALF